MSTKGFSVFCLFTCIIGELFVEAGVMEAGVRPQSKVASDCTLAPDPRSAGSASGRGGRRLTKKEDRRFCLRSLFCQCVRLITEPE